MPGYEDEGTKSYAELWDDIIEYMEGKQSRVSISDEMLYQSEIEEAAVSLSKSLSQLP